MLQDTCLLGTKQWRTRTKKCSLYDIIYFMTEQKLYTINLNQPFVVNTEAGLTER